jgi:hypothetical protein
MGDIVLEDVAAGIVLQVGIIGPSHGILELQSSASLGEIDMGKSEWLSNGSRFPLGPRIANIPAANLRTNEPWLARMSKIMLESENPQG